MLASSLALIVLFIYWEPMGGVIWSAPEGVATAVISGLYAFGWLLLLYTTFLIDHFDLFGLAQVWRHLSIQLEERDLIDAFGSEYSSYKRRTPMLIPRFGSTSSR